MINVWIWFFSLNINTFNTLLWCFNWWPWTCQIQKNIPLTFIKSRFSQMFFQKSVLENFAIFTGKRCFGLNLFFKKKQRAWRPLTQVFSFKYCEIFKNTFFEEHLQTAASDLCNSRNRSSPPEVFLGVLKISSKITREYHAEEGVVRRCCYKFCKFHRKAPMLESPTQVFSCEIFEVFKNTFIYRTPPVATFEYLGFYQPSMMELFWKNS